jgi:hypothetical protein
MVDEMEQSGMNGEGLTWTESLEWSGSGFVCLVGSGFHRNLVLDLVLETEATAWEMRGGGQSCVLSTSFDFPPEMYVDVDELTELSRFGGPEFEVVVDGEQTTFVDIEARADRSKPVTVVLFSNATVKQKLHIYDMRRPKQVAAVELERPLTFPVHFR